MRSTHWLVAMACVVLSINTRAAVHVFHHENVLGTSLELKVVAESEAQATKAEAAALAEIDRLAKIFSAYDPASEFSQWMKTSGAPQRVSPELFEVLGLYDQWREKTGGALDAAAGEVCQLWKRAAQRQQAPSTSELGDAVASVRRAHWKLDSNTLTATHLSGAALVLNSFTKSYIASRACEKARAAANATAMIVNIGGDLIVRGNWTELVNIADPRSDAENSEPIARLHVRDRAVATSGGYRRGVEIDGRWYSHIVDPRNGQPVDRIASATVVAPNASDAGALATAFCVLTPSESLRLAASMRNVECLLITKEGARIASPGWSAIEAPRQLAAVGDVRQFLASPATLDPSFELLVTLELARFEGGRAKRPYVAVWIEDKDQFPIRTLALWFAKPKWLPDLKSWTHSDKLRALADGTDITASVSSATRSPGKYSLKWDGKDDKGKLVAPGKYAVFIEVAREHGTHQVMRTEIDFNGAAQKVDLKSNTEVTAASLDYYRKTDAR